jgi:pimeloyl-ACP methyl ester carboxylesterase
MSAAPQSFHFDRAGVRLAGERWDGNGSDDVVVLLHGGGQTRHSWGRTAERLAAGGRTAIALDARGHGESEWDRAQDYTLDAFVADLVSFVSTLDRPPVLVGASLGGITCLAAVGEHPGLARGLVLVDIVVRPEPEGVARIQDFMNAHHEGFSSLEEVADAIAAYNPVRRRPRDLDGLRKNVRWRDDGRWYWHWDPAFMRIDGEHHRSVEPERLSACASRVEVPTLVVRGAQSDMVSDAGLADMLQLIPHAECVDVHAAAHMVAGDDNDVFTGRLEAFLARLDGDANLGRFESP